MEPNLAVIGSQLFESLVLLFGDVFVLELLLTYNVNGKHQAGHAAQGAGVAFCMDFRPERLVVFQSGFGKWCLLREKR